MTRHYERDPSLYRHMLPRHMCADPASAETFLRESRMSEEKIADITHVPLSVVRALAATIDRTHAPTARDKLNLVPAVLEPVEIVLVSCQ